MELWIFEDNINYKVGYRIKKVLYKGKSKYQKIFIGETVKNGKILLLDNAVMLTEEMEFIYHETIVHTPLFVHPQPKNVLIIGGGDGGTLREVLKHKSVKQVDIVEIDEKVIEVSKKYLKNLSYGFYNPKANIIIEDGIKYVASTDKKYDIIIVDSSDPVGPAKVLFKEKFYKDCFNILNDNGILISQSESPFFMKNYFRKNYKIIKKFFPIVESLLAPVPDYPFGLWGFIFASKKFHPVKDYDPEKYKNSKIKTKFYNDEVHKSYFAMPNFVKDLLK